MSQLADFYVLPAERLAAVVEAAIPHRREGMLKGLLFKRKRIIEEERFEETLQAAARKLPEFPFSGATLVQLSLCAPFLIGSHEDEAKRLENARQAGYVLYDFEAAQRELALPIPSVAELEAFQLADEGRVDPGFAQVVRDGAEHLRGWLREVKPGEIGMLSIG